MIATRITPALEPARATEIPTASATPTTPSAPSIFQLRKLGFLIGLSPPSRWLRPSAILPSRRAHLKTPARQSPLIPGRLARPLTAAALVQQPGRPLPD